MKCRPDLTVPNGQSDNSITTEMSERMILFYRLRILEPRNITIVLRFSGRLSDISLPIGSRAPRPEITNCSISRQKCHQKESQTQKMSPKHSIKSGSFKGTFSLDGKVPIIPKVPI